MSDGLCSTRRVHVWLRHWVSKIYFIPKCSLPTRNLDTLTICTSIINGVKDMDGFRREMNLSLVSADNGTCTPDSQEENALLVRGHHWHEVHHYTAKNWNLNHPWHSLLWTRILFPYKMYWGHRIISIYFVWEGVVTQRNLCSWWQPWILGISDMMDRHDTVLSTIMTDDAQVHVWLNMLPKIHDAGIENIAVSSLRPDTRMAVYKCIKLATPLSDVANDGAPDDACARVVSGRVVKRGDICYTLHCIGSHSVTALLGLLHRSFTGRYGLSHSHSLWTNYSYYFYSYN